MSGIPLDSGREQQKVQKQTNKYKKQQQPKPQNIKHGFTWCIHYPSSLANSSSTISLYFAIHVQGDVLLFSSLSPWRNHKNN